MCSLSRVIFPLLFLLPLLSLLPLVLLPPFGVEAARGHGGNFRLCFCFGVRDIGVHDRGAGDGEKLAAVVCRRRLPRFAPDIRCLLYTSPSPRD